MLLQGCQSSNGTQSRDWQSSIVVYRPGLNCIIPPSTKKVVAVT